MRGWLGAAWTNVPQGCRGLCSQGQAGWTFKPVLRLFVQMFPPWGFQLELFSADLRRPFSKKIPQSSTSSDELHVLLACSIASYRSASIGSNWMQPVHLTRIQLLQLPSGARLGYENSDGSLPSERTPAMQVLLAGLGVCNLYMFSI